MKSRMVIHVATAVALAFSLGVFGCSDDDDDGGNACQQALDKLESCGIDTTGVSSENCTGADKCTADCVNNAECSEMDGTGDGTDFAACVNAC